MTTCKEEATKLSDAELAAWDARGEYQDQKQAAAEASFFSWFFRVAIVTSALDLKKAPVTLIEKSMSALEKQGTAERAKAKVERARRAAERADRSAEEARASLERCRDAREIEPVSFTLTSTLTLRARFFEEKILPPQGWSGTLPMRETTHVVEARGTSFERRGRDCYRVVAVLDEVHTTAPSHTTVVDERGRTMTHTIAEHVTSVKPGRLEVLVFGDDSEGPMGFIVELDRDTKPLRSGQQTLTIRDPDGGCHTLTLPYTDVPSLWPDVFKRLRWLDSGPDIRGWTWREQGDQHVATRSWSSPPGTLLTGEHGEVTLVAERSSMEITVRRRRP
jgi:hypothetical protein